MKYSLHRPVFFHKALWSCCFLLFITLCIGATNNKIADNASHYQSPTFMTIDPLTNTLFVSLSTASKILLYSCEDSEVIGEIPLPMNPAGLAISTDGETLYAAGMSHEGKLFVIDVASKKIRKTISVGHSPVAAILANNGQRLYVANRFSANISVINTRSLSEIKKIKVSREPVALAISKEDKTVFVANHLPTQSSSAGYVSSVVSIIGTDELEVIKEINLPNGSNALNDMAISPDGRFIYVSHILARYQFPTTQITRGWMNTNALSIINVNNLSYYNTILLDDVNNGAANPWGIDVSPDGEKVFVALSGTDELCVIDRQKMHHKIERTLKYSENPVAINKYEILNDLSFIHELRTRIKLHGKGFRQILVAGDNVYLTAYFSSSIHRVNTAGETSQPIVRLDENEHKSADRWGEELFHDATNSYQHWQSCHSCHPGGARVDALNWDLLNDGIGNPKNTKSLLLSHATPPAMISGIRKDMETAVHSGIKHIQYTVRPPDEERAIVAYLKSLKAIPSPFLNNGNLSKGAKKGRKIFVNSGCAKCHAEPYYTNLEKYNVGTGTGKDVDSEFDTPSLIEAWRTAPYLNNGSATTIEDVLTKFNIEDKHGRTSLLSNNEIKYLAEYVKSL